MKITGLKFHETGMSKKPYYIIKPKGNTYMLYAEEYDLSWDEMDRYEVPAGFMGMMGSAVKVFDTSIDEDELDGILADKYETEELFRKLSESGIEKLDGYSEGRNNPDGMKDGDTGFTLKLLFSDGHVLKASGRNAYPEGFEEIRTHIISFFKASAKRYEIDAAFEEESISKKYGIDQVREMAYQFSDLYFEFVKQLRESLGDEAAKKIVQKVLFERAKERALAMIEKAEKEGIERIPENIKGVSNVAYLGWVSEYGCDHCPYGTAWVKRIKENPWFEEYAALYCDVTDTTIGEIFTGSHSHKLHKNVVHFDDSCERTYFPSEKVKNGKYTYEL